MLTGTGNQNGSMILWLLDGVVRMYPIPRAVPFSVSPCDFFIYLGRPYLPCRDGTVIT